MNAPLKPSPIYELAPLEARLTGFDAHGQARIVLDGHTLPARGLCPLSPADIGAQVLVVRTASQPDLPIILGTIQDRPLNNPQSLDVAIDGRSIRIEASESLELKCGQARIQLSADGRIRIRGGYILNHASGIQRIRGAAVQIN